MSNWTEVLATFLVPPTEDYLLCAFEKHIKAFTPIAAEYAHYRVSPHGSADHTFAYPWWAAQLYLEREQKERILKAQQAVYTTKDRSATSRRATATNHSLRQLRRQVAHKTPAISSSRRVNSRSRRARPGAVWLYAHAPGPWRDQGCRSSRQG